MILDEQTMFSNAQAITASAGSTNYYDLGAGLPDIAVGQDLYVVALVTTAFTDVGSDSTVEVKLEQDNDVAFGSPADVQVLGSFAALSAIGSRLVAKLQPEKITERYLRAYYTVANGNLTTGAISCFLVLDAQLFKAYEDNQAILG